jgi:branched-chain amino acid transport system ATP-binding protein
MLRILRQINQTGVSILFIEQNVQTALSISDRGYVLEGGRLAIEGTAEELLASADVKRIFLGG